MKLHLVYPSGPGIGCPQTIGRHLAEGLAKRYQVLLYPWDRLAPIVPGLGDVLLGHPHPAAGTVFKRSMRLPGWQRRIVMAPFNADPRQVSYLKEPVELCERFLAITGPYWWKTLPATVFRPWQARMRPLDLAVDRAEFPLLKRRFNAAGKRRFLYIGHAGFPKNTGFLSRIARALPQMDFSWAGRGRPIPGLKALGWHDFSRAKSQALIAEHDFLINVSDFDANPATVLEAMAWGLLPVCTEQSGYLAQDGVITLPLNDLNAVVTVLHGLQNTSQESLLSLQRENSQRLKVRFAWPRFCADVVRAIEERTSPVSIHYRRSEALSIGWHRLSSQRRLRAAGVKLWARHLLGVAR